MSSRYKKIKEAMPLSAAKIESDGSQASGLAEVFCFLRQSPSISERSKVSSFVHLLQSQREAEFLSSSISFNLRGKRSLFLLPSPSISEGSRASFFVDLLQSQKEAKFLSSSISFNLRGKKSLFLLLSPSISDGSEVSSFSYLLQSQREAEHAKLK